MLFWDIPPNQTILSRYTLSSVSISRLALPLTHQFCGTRAFGSLLASDTSVPIRLVASRATGSTTQSELD